MNSCETAYTQSPQKRGEPLRLGQRNSLRFKDKSDNNGFFGSHDD